VAVAPKKKSRKNRERSAGIMTDYGLYGRGSNSGRIRNTSLPHSVQPAIILCNGYWGIFPLGVKQPRT
jgi:hypothetical protein